MSIYKFSLAALLILVFGVAAFGVTEQQAKGKVQVVPKHAYVYLDGTPLGDGSRDFFTAPGTHRIAVYAYGYTGEAREVTLEAGKNPTQQFTLQPSGAPVTAQFGVLQIEGGGRAAVLLNGKTPDYTVGHGDMFNNHVGWFQQLIVPAGTHEVTVNYRTGMVWSGPVTVAANQRVILYVPSGRTKVETWSDGTKPIARPRSQVGSASAAIAIAPVSGDMAAQPPQIRCNDTSNLNYQSSETLHAAIKNGEETMEQAATSGQQPVQPTHTTTYNFVASGPGGVVNKDATVAVDPKIDSSISATPSEVHYLKIGDKVLTAEPTTVKWETDHANTANIDRMSIVPLSGERVVAAAPTQGTTGQINETQTYTLATNNVCGGTDSKTTSVQVKGMAEPYILSVFFPTGYPAKRHPEVGLVKSQQDQLVKIAQAFQIYADHTPEAVLMIRGFADPRSTNAYNMKLSQRRVELVKSFLIAQGVPANKIQTDALGKTRVLDAQTVAQLESENPLKDGKRRNAKATRLAYNRRVDVEIQPAALESSRYYPFVAQDSKVMWQRTWPGLTKVKDAE